MAKASKRIRLSNVIASYVKVFEPQPKLNGDGMEFSIQVVIPKDHPQLAALKEAIKGVATEAFGKKLGGLSLGLRDNDAEGRADEDSRLEDTMFINARKPESFGTVQVVNKSASKLITDPDQFFSGCMMNIIVTLYSFDTKGNKGVACGIDGIQVVDNDVERWDSKINAMNEFESLGDEEEEAVEDLATEAEKPAPEAEGSVEAADDDIPW